MKISIILPVFNEEKYIKNCINSILESDYPKRDIEVLIVDGMSKDNTRKIIKTFQEKYPFIKLIDNPQKIVPTAMNLAIKEASGEYICRLDAHAKYPSNYISGLLKWSKELNADNVGGVWITDVQNKTNISNSIKEVLSHKIGVGNSSFRIGVESIKEVDTVPFGFYKKDIFEKYGLYDERLTRNQDIELNKRIIRGGGSIYLVPDVTCTYYARENFKDLAKNNFANGKWNILTAYFTKTVKSLSLRHFIPLIFILFLTIPLMFNCYLLSLLIFSLYLLSISIVSFSLRKKENHFIYLVTSFFTLHFSYGLGSLSGVFKVLYLKAKNVF